MAKLKVYNMKKEAVGTVELADGLFAVDYNEPLTRSEVNKTKKKWYKQKGTGNARHDEKSAPQFVGGGVVFAPKPRDFRVKINKKMRDIAFASAISQKIRQDEVIVIDSLTFADAKTKAASEFLKTFGLDKRTIIVTDGKDENVLRATNNIQKVSCVDANLLNVKEVVENKFIVITKNAIKKIEEAYV